VTCRDTAPLLAESRALVFNPTVAGSVLAVILLDFLPRGIRSQFSLGSLGLNLFEEVLLQAEADMCTKSVQDKDPEPRGSL
jgi:hypothetical protein